MRHLEEYTHSGGFVVIWLLIAELLLGVAQPRSLLSEANQFVRTKRHELGFTQPTQRLTAIQQQRDDLEQTHIRYRQTYDGVPVFGAQMIVHFDDTDVASTSGRIVPVVHVNTRPNLTAADATKLAQMYWQQQFSTSSDGAAAQNSSLYVFDKGFILHQAVSEPHLVWEVVLNQVAPRVREHYYIDAHTGQLVYQISAIKQAIHRRIYDCSLGSPCVLNLLSGGYTYGRSEGRSARGANPIYGSTDVDDLYDMVDVTHNYFFATFGRDGANNQGGLGDGVYSDVTNTDVYSYLDAIAPDNCPNAYFDGYSINFCTGVVTTDVVAHEYAHGVGQYSIANGFVYAGESGAIDEAFSDIFGEAVEYYATGDNDWLMGAAVNAGYLIGPLRSLSDPASITDSVLGIPYPDTFTSSNYYCGPYDNSGVHHNSTVLSHAAYLIAMGGTFNNCTITGLGRAKEEQIFYRALTTYVTSAITYNQMYTALLDACDDLYSTDDCKEVKKALKAVALDQTGYCSGGVPVDPNCAAVDNAAYVSAVTSNHASGSYRAGEIIDIVVTFSKAVTSVGDVTLTLETGNIDHSCTFQITNSTSSTCSYTVQPEDSVAALMINSITGTVTDQDGYAITNFTPTRNLNATKTITLDNSAASLTDIVLLTAETVLGKNKVLGVALHFSETVSSIGDIVLTLETGDTDQTCAFSLSTSATASCNYVVKKGDTASPFTVRAIAGTLEDSAGNTTTTFSVPASLTTTAPVIIDGVSPTGSISINAGTTSTNSKTVLLRLSATDKGTQVKKMRFSNDGKTWSVWQKYRKKYQLWDLTDWKNGGTTNSGIKTVYVQFKDRANNRSKKFTDTIQYVR